MKSTQFNDGTGKAYCIPGQDQLSLFSPSELARITPKKEPKRLYCLIESSDGVSWWQELPRVRGEKPWDTCMRYKRESLGRGYWICTYELR